MRVTTTADKKWAVAVKHAGDWTCVICGYRNEGGPDIHAHHIKPYSKYPDLRLVVENGAVLCEVHNKQLGNKEQSIRLSYIDTSWLKNKNEKQK